MLSVLGYTLFVLFYTLVVATNMKCLVVTPEKTVLNMEATFVVLPLADGEHGILPKHTPLIARLGAGELRITGTDGGLTNYYVEGGFAEVLDDTVALLTMFALPAKDLSLAEAEKELEEDLARPTDTVELLGIRHAKLNIDRAKVRLAQKMAGQATTAHR
jgi:F-type H+-transporting ATPase subunit epsilon